MNKKQYIRIGHPSYGKWSNNHFVQHESYKSALADLLSRGVSMSQAHAVINDVMRGAYKTVSNRAHDPIEIQPYFA